MLFGSAESNSMFGYAIASAGDLDQDGYQGSAILFCHFFCFYLVVFVFFCSVYFRSPKIASRRLGSLASNC